MSKYDFIQYLEDGEECKEIPGHSGYFITTRGRVYNSKKKKWLNPVLQKTYKDTRRNKLPQHKRYYYHCYLDGKQHRIHLLVGRNFLPEYKKGLFILHKDETLSYPEINYLENLFVGTNSDNMKDMWSKGRRTINTSFFGKPQYKYYIEGNTYLHNQLEEVGKRYNLTKKGVHSRISNTNYPGWYKEPL
jgi:hypothetical protein